MSASASLERHEAAPQLEEAGRAMEASVRPSVLLAAVAERAPDRMAFRDQPDRETWSGRPRIEWTYRNTARVVFRLATFLQSLKLPPGAPVGIFLPNGSEACVALLAVERAGYSPCLLPIGWSQAELLHAVERAQVATIVSQTRLADERPSELLCQLAAGYFGLRFICAFGPDVPDGVIDLDRAILDTEPSLSEPASEATAGIISFETRSAAPEPFFRPYESLLAATVSYLIVEPVEPGDTIVSLLPPDDHPSLVAGLMASLATGATLEMIGLPDSDALEKTLGETRTVRLVAPGWIEPLLAAGGRAENFRSVALIHSAPVRFKARGDLNCPVTDVLALGERAIIARRRRESGHLSFVLEEGTDTAGLASSLLLIRRDEDGSILVQGPAAEIFSLERGRPAVQASGPGWRPSGFKADVFAGMVIGVR
ncbi:AMP-binding protein [Microvirga massiliensis]|uniref:AMP-binding protein n=1 Tax=Microvirga massiliensis TaxID=1033741 RepID=UPI00066074A3|nr:AMP-binding protein [Microvirga massiliensis]